MSSKAKEPVIDLRSGGVRKFAATNRAWSCLWCGRTLAPFKYPDFYPGEVVFGAYADNAFCTMRCGYAFGVNMARLGKRLEPAP